jgi:hypothetical protein
MIWFMSQRARLRVLRIVGYICLVLAFGFGIAAFVTWHNNSVLDSRGVVTTGTVSNSDYEPQGTSSITVDFTDQSGNDQSQKIDMSGQPIAQGQKVTVSYDPQNPSNLRLQGAFAPSTMSAGGWLGIGGLFAGVGAAALVLRWLLKRWLRRRDPSLA